MLEGLPLSRKFKSYVGCKGAAKKLERWLNDFEFMDIATADQSVDWEKAQRVELSTRVSTNDDVKLRNCH